MKLHWREMWFCFQEFVFVSRETEDLKNHMWIIWIPYTCEYFTTLLLLHSAAGLLLTRPGILPYRFVIDLVISVHACGMLHSSTTVTFTVHHHAIIIWSFISDPISSCYYCQHHCLWKISFEVTLEDVEEAVVQEKQTWCRSVGRGQSNFLRRADFSFAVPT